MQRLRAAGKLTAAQRNPFVKPRPKEELYDLKADPHELNNLADDPKYHDELVKLRKVLQEWEQATNDKVPEKRRPNEFDRETGERLRRFKRPRRKRGK